MNQKTDHSMAKQILRMVWVIILPVLPVAVMFWIWRDARRVPPGVLGGALFRSPWHIVHAGFCMDQPTIGKWFFWSTVFSGTWMGCALVALRICMPGSAALRRTYAVLTLCALFIYLLVHTVPSYWTLQYIHAMGFTLRRSIALGWGIAGYLILITLSCLLVRQVLRTDRRIEQQIEPST